MAADPVGSGSEARGATRTILGGCRREGQPIAQLIGGAPQAASATYIEGTATREALTIRMTKLDGTVLAEVDLKG